MLEVKKLPRAPYNVCFLFLFLAEKNRAVCLINRLKRLKVDLALKKIYSELSLGELLHKCQTASELNGLAFCCCFLLGCVRFSVIFCVKAQKISVV